MGNVILLDDMKDLFSRYDAKVLMQKIINNGAVESELIDAFMALQEGHLRALKEKQGDIFTTPESFRFTTRKEAMKARTLRISKEKPAIIADAACGIGLAAIELSRICEKILCFEIDEMKCALTEKNFELFGIENYEVYNMSSTNEKAKELLAQADVIFIDPQRTESARQREIQENTPELDYFLSNFKDKLIVYEISPRIAVNSIKYDCETELYSEKRRHARTTLYFTNKNESIMRVVNDDEESFEGEYSDYDFSEENYLLLELEEKKQFYDIDTTLKEAGLLNELEVSGINNISECGKAIIGFSNADKIKIPFCERRKVIGTAENAEGLKDFALQIEDFSRIILRYSVSQDDYWKEANRVRKSGNGKQNIYVYKIAGKFIAAI